MRVSRCHVLVRFAFPLFRIFSVDANLFVVEYILDTSTSPDFFSCFKVNCFVEYILTVALSQIFSVDSNLFVFVSTIHRFVVEYILTLALPQMLSVDSNAF